MEKTKRLYSFDMIRVIAIIAVVTIHASAGLLQKHAASSVEFLVGNIADSLTRLGVPLFIMLSGALMLNESKAVDFKKVKSKTLQIALLLVVWSVFYALVFQVGRPLMSGDPISGKDIFKDILFGHYHLWYLYTLIALYLVTPLLRLFVRIENQTYIRWFLILSFFFSFLPNTLNFALNVLGVENNLVKELAQQFHMGFVGAYVGYYVLGWYLVNITIPKLHRVALYAAGVLGLVVNILGIQFLTRADRPVYEELYDNAGVTVLVYSAAVFLLILNGCKGPRSAVFEKGVTLISKLSFGIYILHPLFISLFLIFVPISNALLSIALCWLVSLVGSAVVTWIASKIPFVKLLVRG